MDYINWLSNDWKALESSVRDRRAEDTTTKPTTIHTKSLSTRQPDTILDRNSHASQTARLAKARAERKPASPTYAERQSGTRSENRVVKKLTEEQEGEKSVTETTIPPTPSKATMESLQYKILDQKHTKRLRRGGESDSESTVSDEISLTVPKKSESNSRRNQLDILPNGTSRSRNHPTPPRSVEVGTEEEDNDEYDIDPSRNDQIKENQDNGLVKKLKMSSSKSKKREDVSQANRYRSTRINGLIDDDSSRDSNSDNQLKNKSLEKKINRLKKSKGKIMSPSTSSSASLDDDGSSSSSVVPLRKRNKRNSPTREKHKKPRIESKKDLIVIPIGDGITFKNCSEAVWAMRDDYVSWENLDAGCQDGTLPNQSDDKSSSRHRFVEVSLEYPANGVQEIFWIADPRDPANAYDPAEDLLDTVRIIAEKYVKDKSAREEYLWCDKVNSRTPVYRIRRAKGRRDPVLMDEAVRAFNSAFRKLKDEGKVARTKGDKDLLRHVLFQAYSRVVSPEVDMLKGKLASETYGEILFPFIDDIIIRTNLKKKHKFIDLGCGVGNVLLQVAGETCADSWGIELRHECVMLANAQLAEFKARMRAYGLSHGNVTIVEGDFTKYPNLNERIREADVVFVNNYKFSPELNVCLIDHFLDLKDGAQIVSLVPFTAGRKANYQHQSLDSISKTVKTPYSSFWISWGGADAFYYITTIKRDNSMHS